MQAHYLVSRPRRSISHSNSFSPSDREFQNLLQHKDHVYFCHINFRRFKKKSIKFSYNFQVYNRSSLAITISHPTRARGSKQLNGTETSFRRALNSNNCHSY